MTEEEIRASALAWRDGDPDETTRTELTALLAKPLADTDLADRFAAPLEFGTAGLRGVIGAGPNRMNRAVVRRTSAGLRCLRPRSCTRRAHQGRRHRLRRSHPQPRDGRGTPPGSSPPPALPAKLFSHVAATPLTSFATKHHGAAAGVMVTASHNPAEYNGYKVYWTNSAQIIPPTDEGIAAAIAQIGPAKDVPLLSLDECEGEGPAHVSRRGDGARVPRRHRQARRPRRWRPRAPHRLHRHARRRERPRHARLRRGQLHQRRLGAGAGQAGREVPHRRLSQSGREGGDGPVAGARPPDESGAGARQRSRCRSPRRRHPRGVVADRVSAAHRQPGGRPRRHVSSHRSPDHRQARDCSPRSCRRPCSATSAPSLACTTRRRSPASSGSPTAPCTSRRPRATPSSSATRRRSATPSATSCATRTASAPPASSPRWRRS